MIPLHGDVDGCLDAARVAGVDLLAQQVAGEVQVLSNDPANGLLTVDCTMHVTGVPRVAWDPEPLDFGTLFVGYPDTLALTVSNVGTDHLSVTSMTPGSSDFTVTPAALELDPLQSATVQVVFAPAADGDRSTTLTLASNDPDSPHVAHLVGQALFPPVVSTEPDTVVGAAPPGGTKTKILTLCNEGGSDLVWEAATAEISATAVQVYDYLEVGKAEDVDGSAEPTDPRPGILGTGGPDAFGYTWTDSDEPGGPVYDWTDIAGVGTPIPFPSYNDDGNVGPLPIGFDFPFYGNTFDEFYACTNGWMSFTSTATSYSNQPLPNSGAPENLLAPFWDDMVYDESDGNSAYYYNDGSRLIIQYHVRRIAQFSPPYYKFQVILYPNGDIVYQYHTLGSTLYSHTIGIQNATRDDGLTVVYNDDSYIHENLAIRFSSAAPWLSVSPESGVLAPGDCVELAVTMDASELTEGDYQGLVTITSNDPATPTDLTPVVFHVAQFEATYTDIDPNTLNLDSNGRWITAYVELPPEYDPEDVVLETVTFNGVVPADRMSVGDENGNGIPDLMFKFDRGEVEGILEAGDSVQVCVTGEIEDTAWFLGCDAIRVIRPRVVWPNGGELLGATSRVEIAWTNPEGWSVDYADVYYSTDGGESWSVAAEGVTGETYLWNVPESLTETALIRVYLFDNKGLMGYDTSDEPFEIGPLSTGVVGGLQPQRFALLQNAPNPFRSTTSIAFALPEESRVSLRIYDVAGRVVRTLESDLLPAGRYQATWDGRDDARHLVPSGIYFYRIQANDFSATKRLFFLR